MKLVIAEKPSVGQSIAKVLGASARHDGHMEGAGYVVSWCFGHLVELAMPDAYDEKFKKWATEDLPILPSPFIRQVTGDKKKQFNLLKSLMQRDDVDEIVCATDAGREGELIFRLVYNQAKCKKPFSRLWISSMEDAAIRDGFADLRPGHDYDDLYAAAQCRDEADWLVGINATRLFTTVYGKRLPVGRVQTPTLAMIVARNNAVANFVKQKYMNVHLKAENGLEVVKEKIFSDVEAEAIRAKCDGKEAVVTLVEETKKSAAAPKLYDLTTLQREANRYFSMTAQQTLDTVQALYERKLLTYPRTDSRFLTEDMADTAFALVGLIKKTFDFGTAMGDEPDIKRIVNNAKVTDHHAIIPTAEIAKLDLARLSEREHKILELVAQQMLCATSPAHLYLETKVEVACEGEVFKAKGKQVLEEGWKAVEAARKGKSKEEDADEEDDRTLPKVFQGQRLFPVAATLTEHYTTPPKQYTEDSLLSAMENAGNEFFDEDTEKKGIGTPATRASIIEKLVASKLVSRKGKQILPTDDGIALIATVPEEVKSPKMTAEWENTLMQVQRGETAAGDFMAGIEGMVKDLCEKYGEATEGARTAFSAVSAKEVIGECPRCGHDVVEGQKSFHCSNRECGFALWKENRYLEGMRKKMTKGMAKGLLDKGKVGVKGLYSQRTGKTFDALVVMEDDGERTNFKLEFPPKKSAGSSAKASSGMYRKPTNSIGRSATRSMGRR